MAEEIPTDVRDKIDISQMEGKALFQSNPKRMPQITSELQQEESAIQTASFVELMKDMQTPTKLKSSKAHELLMKEQGLSNYPSVEYAEMMAKFEKASSYFLELGYPSISAQIMFDRQNIMWNLQGVNFGLRKINTTTRAEIVRQDRTESSQQQKGGINLDPRSYLK